MLSRWIWKEKKKKEKKGENNQNRLISFYSSETEELNGEQLLFLQDESSRE